MAKSTSQSDAGRRNASNGPSKALSARTWGGKWSRLGGIGVSFVDEQGADAIHRLEQFGDLGLVEVFDESQHAGVRAPFELGHCPPSRSGQLDDAPPAIAPRGRAPDELGVLEGAERAAGIGEIELEGVGELGHLRRAERS